MLNSNSCKVCANQLEAKIAAQNAANSEANRIQAILLSAFSPLIGKKVVKIGGLMEKYKSLVPETSELQIYRNGGSYELSFTVRATRQFDSFSWAGVPMGQAASYAQANIPVGKLDNDILTEVFQPQVLRTDYNSQEIIQARKELEQAEKVAREAESRLCGFGRYDN